MKDGKETVVGTSEWVHWSWAQQVVEVHMCQLKRGRGGVIFALQPSSNAMTNLGRETMT